MAKPDKSKPERAPGKGAQPVSSEGLEPSLFIGGPTVLFKWKAAPHWPVEYVSPNVQDVLGYSPEQLMNGTTPYDSLVVPSDLERIAAELRQHSETDRETFEQEYRIQRADGQIRWVYDFTRILRDAKGHITHYLGYLLDTTDRRMAEDALRDSNTRYKAMVEGFDGLIYICSSDYRVMFANKRLVDRTGYDPVGHSCFKVLHKRETICPWCVSPASLRGKTSRWEIQSPLDNRWYDVINTPLPMADGTLAKMSMIRDITERKSADDLIKRRDDILQAVAFAAERFMKSSDWMPMIQEILQRLGKASQASRVHLFQRHEGPATESVYSLRYEWTAPGIPPQLYNPRWQRASLSQLGLSRQDAALCKGEIVKGHARELAAKERESLLQRDVLSFLIVPVPHSNGFWGFIGFDQVNSEREWPVSETDALKAAAGILGSAIQRVQMEAQLRHSQELLQRVLDNVPQFVFWKDRQSEFLGCNRQFARIAGLEAPEQIIGKTDYDLAWSREQAESYRAWDQRIMQEDRAEYHIIEPQLQADGKEAWLDTNKVCLHDAQGQVTGILGTFEDITERQQTEQNMRRLAAFAQYNPNPVLEFHEDGSLAYANQAAQDLARSLELSEVTALLPSHTPELVQECLAFNRSLRGLEVNVSGRILNWIFFPVQAGKVVHGYGFDTTERTNLESQIRQLQKMDAVGRLAGGIAHDFNNILTAILGYTSVLMAEKDLPAHVLEQLGEVSSAAERASSLTRQLLTFSRRQVMQTHPLQLNEVLHNMTQMLKRIIGENIRLDFSYGDRLPLILADEVMVEQVILNLAVNARDAMMEGGQLFVSTELVRVRAGGPYSHPEAQPGDYVCLAVKDTGCGMDESVQANLFEPFFSTKAPGKGTGLGLATVYGIIKQHDGWIEAQSQPGQGALFKVFLPATAAQGAQAPRPAPGATAKVKGGTETILVAEDEETVRWLIRNTLKRQGYKILEASSGHEAVSVWEQHQAEIDLLLTDMVMPGGMSGRDLALRLQAEKIGLKVLYTSGYSVDSFGEDFLAQHPSQFMSKPFSPETLARNVREILDRQHPS